MKNSVSRTRHEILLQLDMWMRAISVSIPSPPFRAFKAHTELVHKLFLGDKMEDILSCGLWGARLLFTTESPRECLQVVKAYLGQSDYRPNGLTRGLYYRGVE